MTNRVGPNSSTMYTAEALFGHEPRVTYSPGITREKLDGQTDYVGHVRVTWTFAFLTVSQWDTARSTLFTPDANDYSGECYIETRDDDDNDIESDALAIFPTPEQLDRWGGGYRDVSITFVLTDTGAAIPPGGGGGDYVTETELTAAIATHAGEASAHHDPVTLSADLNGNLLSLSTQELGLDAQAANTVFAGPSTGGDAVPAFRSLVAADLPAATTSAQGAVELATNAEAQAGASTTVAVTPAALRADIPATLAASRGVRLDEDGYLNMPNGGRVVTDAVYARDSDGLKLYEDSGKGVFVQDSTGYVGIGTASPTALTEIADTGANDFGPILSLRNSSTGINATTDYILGEIFFTGDDIFSSENGTGAKISGMASGAWGTGSQAYPSELQFWTNDGASLNQVMVIDQHGNVGIGTTSPDAKCDINGVLALQDVNSPSAVAGHSLFYSVSGEAYVKDDSGNATLLSPHRFDLVGGPSESMAWAYYSERDGRAVNVDMMKAMRLLEQLSGEELVVIRDLADARLAA